MNVMNVMVIGGAGFVGSHVVDALLRAGHEVSVVDNFVLGREANLVEAQKSHNFVVYREDARQLTALGGIIDQESPDVVVNLAMKCLMTSWDDPEGAFDCGVQIALNLGWLLRKGQFGRLVHFSSSEVYGTMVGSSMSEEHRTDPTTPYAIGKLAADQMLLTYEKMFGVKVSIVRPFNMVGERQNWSQYAAIVPRVVAQLMRGEVPAIEGDGSQTRDFSYVGDVAALIPRVVGSDVLNGRVVNVGSGSQTDIKTVMRLICEAYAEKTGEKVVEPTFAPRRQVDVDHHCADTSLARSLLGWEPMVPLQEAIRRGVFAQVDVCTVGAR